MINKQKIFSPNWKSPPGDTIEDLRRERDWNHLQLAQRLGVSKSTLNQLIKGELIVNSEIAFGLAAVFGTSEQFWLRREAEYRQQSARLDAESHYQNWHDWLKIFPIKELKKAHILPNQRLNDGTKSKFVEDLLKFFSVATPQQWETTYLKLQANFRRAQTSDTNIGAITAWLRLGEIEVEEVHGKAYYDDLVNVQFNPQKFRTAITEIRKLTVCPPEEFQPKMQEFCSNAGVILIFIPAIPKAKVSGVARWVTKQSPMIQMSLFGKSNDKFWFTFFHEAAHILLHAKEKNSIFLDDNFDVDSATPLEAEANEFAENILIPPEHLENISRYKSEQYIINFANEIGIHPGIVVGRLQKEKIISYRSHLNKLKESYEIAEQGRKALF